MNHGAPEVSRAMPGAVLSLSLAALLLVAGCAAPDDTRARIIELELAVTRLTKALEGVGSLEARLSGVEATRRVHPDEHGALLSGQAELAARVAELSARVEALSLHVEEGARRVAVAPPPSPSHTVIPHEGARLPEGLAPPPGRDEPLEVLTVGAGDLLLVRGKSGLERIELAGVEAPRRAEEYARQPRLAARHRERLGAVTGDDAAWEASRAHLEQLLAGKSVRLRDPAARRNAAGALRARVDVEGLDLDLSAAMVRDGFALAGEVEGKAPSLRLYEEDARVGGRGLFGKDWRTE